MGMAGSEEDVAAERAPKRRFRLLRLCILNEKQREEQGKTS